jgi:hypothetical protein
MTTTKKAKVKLNLRKLTVEEKIVFAKQIVTSMTGNANFTTPVPALAGVTTTIAAAETANADLENARKIALTKASTLDDKLSDLDIILNQLCAYVENTAKGDETKIKSAGMSIRSSNAPIGIPAAPGNFLAAAITEAEMELTWDVVNGAKSYIVQFTTDVSASSNWTLATACTKSKATVKNLESGKKYWFRVAALGSAGQGPWSDPATKYSI